MEEEERERLVVSKVFNNINLLMSTTHKSMGLSSENSPMLSQYHMGRESNHGISGVGMSEALLNTMGPLAEQPMPKEFESSRLVERSN